MKTKKNIMAISLRGLNQITQWETITGMAQEWSRKQINLQILPFQ